VHQLAGGVRIDRPVASARLHATAHGIYEAFVNGTRVGDQELTPGFTAYRSRLSIGKNLRTTAQADSCVSKAATTRLGALTRQESVISSRSSSTSTAA
jgi:hypothetical protein